jgi:hypothetical protein
VAKSAADRATAIGALAACVWLSAALASATLAGDLTAGAYQFSDKLGGFRLVSASGSGTRGDPVVIVEEIAEVAPVTLIIRRLRPPPQAVFDSRAALHLVKVVVNRSDRVWAGFELELQEILHKPSIYTDGLSFNQYGAADPDVGSDSFIRNRRDFEPYDRIGFQEGHVDPAGKALFHMVITDPTPRREFYLVQDPQLLSAGLPGAPRIYARRQGSGSGTLPAEEPF